MHAFDGQTDRRTDGLIDVDSNRELAAAETMKAAFVHLWQL